MKLKVRYTAVFEKTIEVDDRNDLVRGPTGVDYANEFSDEIADIEPGEGEYQDDTWEVESVVPVDNEGEPMDEDD